MKTNACLAAVLLFAACSRDVEKLRDEQDGRILKEGRAVVTAEFKDQYQKSPSDPKVAYLYGRLVTGEERRTVAERLVKDAPEFAWGHFLLRLAHQDRGQYEEALAELKKAAALAPESKAIKSAVATESELTVVNSTPAEAVIGRIMKAGVDGHSEDGSIKRWVNDRVDELTGTDMDAISAWFNERPVQIGDLDVLVTNNTIESNDDDLLVRVFVRNRTSASIVLKGDDIKSDRVGACFTAEGLRFGPTPETYSRNEKGQCRSCYVTDITIPPGSMGRPHLYFRGRPDKFERCVLFNTPRSGHTLMVKLGK